MKVTFYSNFMNHHQSAFCREMAYLLGHDFRFVATEPIEDARVKFGYEDLNHSYPFIIRSYEDDIQYEQAVALASTSDVVIIGSAPDGFVRKRILQNKLTFRYMERILKEGYLRLFDPRVAMSVYLHHTRYRKKNLHLLCASAYASIDMSIYAAYPTKKYRWGYFPDIYQTDVSKLLQTKSRATLEILWVGRFIKLKHPEHVIQVAARLNQRGHNFRLSFIGSGPLEDELKTLVAKYELLDSVRFLGSMHPNVVRKYMEGANIFLFTSDRHEGWGAVLNEAMNSACAVVASHAIGSVPFLIEHGKNGLMYQNGDVNDLYLKVRLLLENSELRESLSLNAYNTMIHKWNPKIAAQRFLMLSGHLLDGSLTPFEDGICSPAPRLTGYAVNRKKESYI